MAPASKKNPAAGTIGEALRDRERKTGKHSPLLDAVRVPDGFEYLFAMFWEIRNGASEGMSGARITWRDLADYQAITGIELDAFEVEALLQMDSALRVALMKEADDGH